MTSIALRYGLWTCALTLGAMSAAGSAHAQAGDQRYNTACTNHKPARGYALLVYAETPDTWCTIRDNVPDWPRYLPELTRRHELVLRNESSWK